MEIALSNKKGSVIISDEALSAIAVNAARDVEGVSSFSNKPVNVVNTIKSGSLKVTSPVKIVQDTDGVSVTIFLNLSPNQVIKTVTQAVQKSVKEAIQNMTGCLVKKVNVTVTGIDFSSSAKNEPTETEE